MNTLEIVMAEMEKYFFASKKKLQNVILSHLQTPRGRRLQQYRVPNHYGEFLRYHFLEDSELSTLPLDLYLPSGQDIEFTTSGTSGMKKRIFRPFQDKAIPLPSYLDKIIRENDTVFVHSKRYQLESFYWLLDKTYSEDYSAIPREYDDLESVITILKQGNVLCIYDYPTTFHRFLFLVQKGLQEGRITLEEIHKKNVLIELTGEPMTLEDLRHAVSFATTIFQSSINIWATYGSAEFGGIAYYDFNGDDLQIDYKVASERVFVEVIDPASGNPLINSLGEIVVTAFRNEGTIIVRYRTGDKGILNFRDNIPYLSHIQRPSVVFVAGSQFNIQDTLNSLREKIGVIAHLSVSKEKDDQKGCEKLSLKIFILESFGIPENVVKEFVRNKIIEDAKLHSEVSIGLVDFDIDVLNLSLGQIASGKGWSFSH